MTHHELALLDKIQKLQDALAETERRAAAEVLAEREACAKQCDDFVMGEENAATRFDQGADWAAKELARQIRARGPVA